MFLKPEGMGEIPPAAPGPTVSKYYNVRTRILRYRYGGVSSYTYKYFNIPPESLLNGTNMPPVIKDSLRA